MPPIRTAKKGGKRTAKPQKQTAGDRKESQVLSGTTADAITEKPNIKDGRLEIAASMDSAPS
jgi:hypothetical protein